jgi:hypothetical protein
MRSTGLPQPDSPAASTTVRQQARDRMLWFRGNGLPEIISLTADRVDSIGAISEPTPLARRTTQGYSRAWNYNSRVEVLCEVPVKKPFFCSTPACAKGASHPVLRTR